MTELVCRLTYKQLVVFKESKPGLWASKIGFRATPTLLGWNKDLDDQMLGSGLLLPVEQSRDLASVDSTALTTAGKQPVRTSKH